MTLEVPVSGPFKKAAEATGESNERAPSEPVPLIPAMVSCRYPGYDEYSLVRHETAVAELHDVLEHIPSPILKVAVNS